MQVGYRNKKSNAAFLDKKVKSGGRYQRYEVVK